MSLAREQSWPCSLACPHTRLTHHTHRGVVLACRGRARSEATYYLYLSSTVYYETYNTTCVVVSVMSTASDEYHDLCSSVVTEC